MLKYILKRIGLAILCLLGVSLILYILVRCMPMNYIDQKVAAMSKDGVVPQEIIDQLYKNYGLDNDTFVGYLIGYGKWLLSICRLDFGVTFSSGAKVTTEIASKMQVSFVIAFIAIIIEYMIAIPLGVTAATHQYSIRDYVVTFLVIVGISMPSFFFGKIIQNLFSLKLGWFSYIWNPGETFFGYVRAITLPVLVMVILGVGGTMRYMRTNMLEVLNSDYIRTARAKGLPESKVIYKHAFRNTMIPIVTVFAGVLPSLFSGAMITEQVFDIDGIGNWALKMMTSVDIPAIMGYNMFLALLSVIGVLLSDLMYAVVDPRVKLA